MMRIVAELSLMHEGSLGTAMRMVDACREAGADAVKVQCHLNDPVRQFRPGTWFPQDATRQDYWERTGFTGAQWVKLRAHALRVGIEFGVSCFSLDAFEVMQSVGVDFWKVGSAQLTDAAYIRAVVATRQPVLVSTGMSGWDEIRGVIAGVPPDRLTLLQCTSEYPCPPERVGVNVMQELRRSGCRVGLSDHSGTIWPGIVAAYLGADVLEVHVTLSRWSFGPDVPASITVEELRQLVSGVRFAERMQAVDKDAVAAGLGDMRRVFRGFWKNPTEPLEREFEAVT